MGVGAGLYMCVVVVKSSRSLSHLLMSSCTHTSHYHRQALGVKDQSANWDWLVITYIYDEVDGYVGVPFDVDLYAVSASLHFLLRRQVPEHSYVSDWELQSDTVTAIFW